MTDCDYCGMQLRRGFWQAFLKGEEKPIVANFHLQREGKKWAKENNREIASWWNTTNNPLSRMLS